MEINNLKVDKDRNRTAKKAGLLYLLIIVSSILTLIFIDSQYSVSGKVVETINNIVANDLFFRINTAYNLLMYIGVIALSVYLYETLKVINKPLALMAFSFRLCEAIMGGIQVLCYLIVLLLLNESNFILAFDMDAKLSLVELFMGIFDQLIIIIFAFLGLGSLIFFYLFYKSKYIPRAISIWGMCSFFLVIVGSFISIFYSNNAYMILGSQAILFEIFIGGWLLIKGINTDKKEQ